MWLWSVLSLLISCFILNWNILVSSNTLSKTLLKRILSRKDLMHRRKTNAEDSFSFLQIYIEYQVIQITSMTYLSCTNVIWVFWSLSCPYLMTSLNGKLSTIEIIRSCKVTHSGIYHRFLRACLHGGGGPQVGEEIHEESCKCDQSKMRDYMDRQATPSKWVTSPTWGPPSPCKQTLSSAQWNFC